MKLFCRPSCRWRLLVTRADLSRKVQVTLVTNWWLEDQTTFLTCSPSMSLKILQIIPTTYGQFRIEDMKPVDLTQTAWVLMNIWNFQNNPLALSSQLSIYISENWQDCQTFPYFSRGSWKVRNIKIEIRSKVSFYIYKAKREQGFIVKIQMRYFPWFSNNLLSILSLSNRYFRWKLYHRHSTPPRNEICIEQYPDFIKMFLISLPQLLNSIGLKIIQDGRHPQNSSFLFMWC